MKRPLSATFPVGLLAGVLTGTADACTTCMGSADLPIAPAMNASILFLLVVILGMLAGFIGFMFYLARRERSHSADGV